jgi:hypothetical protein
MARWLEVAETVHQLWGGSVIGPVRAHPGEPDGSVPGRADHRALAGSTGKVHHGWVRSGTAVSRSSATRMSGPKPDHSTAMKLDLTGGPVGA